MLGWAVGYSVNIVRILLAVFAIVALLVGTLSGVDSHTPQFAILPLVCLFLASSLSIRFTLHERDLPELTASPRLLAARAPPLS
jgi:hypothetical protein